VQKDQIQWFYDEMFGIDSKISKADIIVESNTRFEQAQDQETII